MLRNLIYKQRIFLSISCSHSSSSISLLITILPLRMRANGTKTNELKTVSLLIKLSHIPAYPSTLTGLAWKARWTLTIAWISSSSTQLTARKMNWRTIIVFALKRVCWSLTAMRSKMRTSCNRRKRFVWSCERKKYKLSPPQICFISHEPRVMMYIILLIIRSDDWINDSR